MNNSTERHSGKMLRSTHSHTGVHVRWLVRAWSRCLRRPMMGGLKWPNSMMRRWKGGVVEGGRTDMLLELDKQGKGLHHKKGDHKEWSRRRYTRVRPSENCWWPLGVSCPAMWRWCANTHPIINTDIMQSIHWKQRLEWKLITCFSACYSKRHTLSHFSQTLVTITRAVRCNFGSVAWREPCCPPSGLPQPFELLKIYNSSTGKNKILLRLNVYLATPVQTVTANSPMNNIRVEKIRYGHYRLWICRVLLNKLSSHLASEVQSRLFFVVSVFFLKYQNRTHFVTLVSSCKRWDLFSNIEIWNVKTGWEQTRLSVWLCCFCSSFPVKSMTSNRSKQITNNTENTPSSYGLTAHCLKGLGYLNPVTLC